jgi:hypothetical protein
MIGLETFSLIILQGDCVGGTRRARKIDCGELTHPYTLHRYIIKGMVSRLGRMGQVRKSWFGEGKERERKREMGAEM